MSHRINGAYSHSIDNSKTYRRRGIFKICIKGSYNKWRMVMEQLHMFFEVGFNDNVI